VRETGQAKYPALNAVMRSIAMAATVNPATLTTLQRVNLMIGETKKRYGLTLKINQDHRDPKQAQQFHIAHMFLFNMFEHQVPKKENRAVGHRTISWKHLSDPNISWVLIDDLKTDFLRTKAGAAAQPEGGVPGKRKWKPGGEPDEKASRSRMTMFLQNHRVSGMAAPGINGCGEPCGCGGRESKHISYEACDISGMPDLARILAKNSKGFSDPVDEYLKEFQLCRPLAHKPKKQREEWHVESIRHVQPKQVRKNHPKSYLYDQLEPEFQPLHARSTIV
jgi:hypothetical protein